MFIPSHFQGHLCGKIYLVLERYWLFFRAYADGLQIIRIWSYYLDFLDINLETITKHAHPIRKRMKLYIREFYTEKKIADRIRTAVAFYHIYIRRLIGMRLCNEKIFHFGKQKTDVYSTVQNASLSYRNLSVITYCSRKIGLKLRHVYPSKATFTTNEGFPNSVQTQRYIQIRLCICVCREIILEQITDSMFAYYILGHVNMSVCSMSVFG